jgi:hypothetical protein
MDWILVALAASSTGANTKLGTYFTEFDCRVGIYNQLVIDMRPPSVDWDPLIQQRAEELAKQSLRTQTSYKCIALAPSKK